MRRLVLWLFVVAAAAVAAWLLLRAVRDDAGPPSAAPTSAPASGAQRPEPSERGAPAPFDPTPSALPGEPHTVELMEPPVDHYADTAATDADKPYADLVAKLGRAEIAYDPALGRAARELAFQQSLLGGIVPLDIVDFLLRAGGAVDRTVEQGYTATSGDGAQAARARLEKLLDAPDGGGPMRVGIGEVWIPGAKLPRVVAILVSRREVDVDPAPRRVEPGATWTLSGVLPRGHGTPSALVLRPDGQLEELPVAASGRRFRVEVPVGRTPGTVHVSLGAVGPRGAGTLVQVPVEVGRALPDEYSTRLPPDERAITTSEAAEALALALLNADRARFGLPPLTRDAQLDAVARAHSLDMRDHGFFGHLSPQTGAPGDRIAAAGYRALAHAENIALESSIHAAQAGLLGSLGHRRNILAPELTHVGLGAVRGEGQGHPTWHLTQLFARPVVAIDPRAEADRLLGVLSERRRAAGLRPLAREPALDRVALDHARTAAAAPLDGLARRALADAERAGLTPGKAHAWIQKTHDLAALEPPAEAGDAAYTRIGIGIVQRSDDPQGATGVVLLFAGDPR